MLDGLHQRELPCARRSARVDVLEVHVADAIAVLGGEGDRVDAADQQVAGVQAPRHARVLERELDVVLGLQDGARVGVQHELDALRRVAMPASVVEVLAGARPRRRRRAGCGGDQSASCTVAATNSSPPACASCAAARARVLAVEVGLVDDDRHEPADELQPVAVQDRPGLCAVLGQPAERTQLGRGDAELDHLREHAVRRRAADPSRAPRTRPTRWGRRPVVLVVPSSLFLLR